MESSSPADDRAWGTPSHSSQQSRALAGAWVPQTPQASSELGRRSQPRSSSTTFASDPSPGGFQARAPGATPPSSDRGPRQVHGSPVVQSQSAPSTSESIMQALLYNIVEGRRVRREARHAWSQYESGINAFGHELVKDSPSVKDQENIDYLRRWRRSYTESMPRLDNMEDAFECLCAQILLEHHPTVRLYHSKADIPNEIIAVLDNTMQVVTDSYTLLNSPERYLSVYAARQEVIILEGERRELNRRATIFKGSDEDAGVYSKLMIEIDLCDVKIFHKKEIISRLNAETSEPLQA